MPSQNVTNNDTFIILDLDRTLLDTSLVFDIFQSVLDDRGYHNSRDLHDARERLEATGGSFDVFNFIKSMLSSQQFEEVMDAFRAKCNEYELLNDEAREFLAFLESQHANFGILTYGSEEWQREKLMVAGLGKLPSMIIAKKGKGRLVSSWYRKTNDRFIVPSSLGSGTYKRLVIIDDKASEFEGLTSKATGLLYRPQGSILPSQAGDIRSDTIRQVRSFKEAADTIKELL